MYILHCVTPCTYYLCSVIGKEPNKGNHQLIYSDAQGQFIGCKDAKVDFAIKSHPSKNLMDLYQVRDITAKQHFYDLDEALIYLNNLLLVV